MLHVARYNGSRRRRRTAAIATVLVMVPTALTAIATAQVGVASASAAQPTAAYLNGTETAISSSTHTKLRLGVSASGYYAMSDPSTSVSVALYRGGEQEEHSWTFSKPVVASDLTAKGLQTLDFPLADTAPYAVVNLHLVKPKPPRIVSCDANNYDRVQRVQLSGILFLNTRSTGKHPWGHIGSKTKKFRFTGWSQLDVVYGGGGYDCHEERNPCAATIEFEAASADGLTRFAGDWTAKGGSLDAVHTTELTKPVGATRTDQVYSTEPTPAITGAAGSAAAITVSTRKGSGESGSMTLRATGPGTTEEHACRSHGKTIEGSETDWRNATAANGHPPLVFHEQIYGPIELAASNGINEFSVLKP